MKEDAGAGEDFIAAPLVPASSVILQCESIERRSFDGKGRRGWPSWGLPALLAKYPALTACVTLTKLFGEFEQKAIDALGEADYHRLRYQI